MFRPECKLIGENGNIFNLLGIAMRTLNDNGMNTHAMEMRDRVFEAESYNEALGIISDYVEIV